MPLNYHNHETQLLVESLYRNGFTQEGVDKLYATLGLGPAPRVPDSLIGKPVRITRGGYRGSDGTPIRGDALDFINQFGSQSQDPYREYGAGNYLGLAGMLVGGYGAAGGFNGGAALSEGGGGAGIFSNGGTAGMAGVGGGNAGALASSGAISGGAGGLSLGGGMGASGGWLDTLIDIAPDVYGAIAGSNAAGDAADAQVKGAEAAIAETRRQYDQTRADFAPYREVGYGALGQLAQGTGAGGDFNRDFTIADFQKDPGYEFRLNEGRRALEGSAAARTGVQNGRTLRELERYGQDYGSGEYQNSYNRFNNDRTTRFNRLAALANVGQTATGSVANAGQNASNNVADATIDMANARAAGRVGQANAVIGGVESLGNWYRNRRYGGQPQNSLSNYGYG